MLKARVRPRISNIGVIQLPEKLVFRMPRPAGKETTSFGDQAQSARICRAFFTSSSEPAKSTFNLPNFRATETLIVVKPLFFIRKWICLCASLAP